jgi:DNA-binding Xre family transcriptional regulator
VAAKAGIRRATLNRLGRGLTKGIDFSEVRQTRITLTPL